VITASPRRKETSFGPSARSCALRTSEIPGGKRSTGSTWHMEHWQHRARRGSARKARGGQLLRRAHRRSRATAKLAGQDVLQSPSSLSQAVCASRKWKSAPRCGGARSRAGSGRGPARRRRVLWRAAGPARRRRRRRIEPAVTDAGGGGGGRFRLPAGRASAATAARQLEISHRRWNRRLWVRFAGAGAGPGVGRPPIPAAARAANH
jgi:hypothetical protein